MRFGMKRAFARNQLVWNDGWSSGACKNRILSSSVACKVETEKIYYYLGIKQQSGA